MGQAQKVQELPGVRQAARARALAHEFTADELGTIGDALMAAATRSGSEGKPWKLIPDFQRALNERRAYDAKRTYPL